MWKLLVNAIDPPGDHTLTEQWRVCDCAVPSRYRQFIGCDHNQCMPDRISGSASLNICKSEETSILDNVLQRLSAVLSDPFVCASSDTPVKNAWSAGATRRQRYPSKRVASGCERE